jgi:hypothetical protein
MELTLLLLTLLVLLVLGVPVAFALGIASLVTFIYMDIAPLVAFQRIASGVNVFALMAIPFFIFAGDLMQQAGIAERLVRVANAAVGRIRGGLGPVNVGASMMFGGVSGSAIASAAALGSTLIPMMTKRGYDADYSVNVTTTAAVTGLLIPPSHNMIIYAAAAGVSISVADLFMAGVVPGVVTGLILMAVAWLGAVKRGYPRGEFPGWGAFARAFAKSQLGGGTILPTSGCAFVSVRNDDKPFILGAVRKLIEQGFTILATGGTHAYLTEQGLEVGLVKKVLEGRPHIVDAMKNGEVQLVFNTTEGKQSLSDSFSIRRTALMMKIPYYTTTPAALASAQAIAAIKAGELDVRPLQGY